MTRALGCRGRISSAGSGGTGRAAPRGMAPALRDADLGRGGRGGGPRARRPGARSSLEYLQGLGWEEVSAATCELGLCKRKKNTAA